MRLLDAACRRLMIVAPLLLLGACSGTMVNRDVAPAQLSDKAVVVLSVSHDDGAGSAADAIFYMDNNRFTERAVLKSTQMTSKSEFKGRYGHLFVLEVAPGHHTIDGWQVVSGGLRITTAQKLPPLEFDVAKGDVIYLGDLHAGLVLGHRTLFGGRVAADARVGVIDRSDEDIPLAEAQAPALKQRMRTALLPLGPWGEAGTRKVFDPPTVVLPTK